MCSTISSTPRLLGLCFLLLCFLQARSHPDRVRNPSVCQTLNIGHDSAESLSESELSVKLVSTSNDGTEHAVSCYNPSTEYKIVIESLQGRSIRGLIVVQDGNEGDFPYLPNRSILPTGLTHALCERSVSHNCFSGSCNFGTTVSFPLRSPCDTTKTLAFKYSIVFKYTEFIENKRFLFPPCAPLQCEADNFEVSASTLPVKASNGNNKICRGDNSRMSVKEIRVITENNMTYTCTAQKAVKKKHCSSGCSYNCKTLCCTVVGPFTYVDREFNCVPDDLSADPTTKVWKVRDERHSNCVCYNCNDVCPAPTVAPTESLDSSGEGNQDGDHGNNIEYSIVPELENDAW